MAKGSVAKGNKGPSIHSRAARRATSPGIDTDKSLKQVRAPQESVDRRPAVLAAHHAGGVSKKAKSGRKAVLSTRARRRQERSMDRAEAIMDRTAVKVQKSKGHARVIHNRRKTWDEVNREAFELEEQRKLGKKAKAKMEEDAAVAAFYADDGDAEMEGAGDDWEEVAGETEAVSVSAAAAPVDVVEEDIL
ncbi:Alb1-domain-containing protein [Chaetomium sp. MPI-CAGE-AT-0009]|nr:Alb1-domain-containing protein [Chaetomium sp. MPI-CAGE-AT-0009]